MAFDKDAFLTALDSMTVLELNDLVKAIEEKFGVSAAAMAAPAAAGGGGGGAAAAEEKTEFSVVLAEAGANKVADGYPSSLDEWIKADGLKALKVKLRGNDAAWDFERLKRIAEVGLPLGVELFTADFNCTVMDPAYVNGVLDRVKAELPELWKRLSYVEQPFPYELEEHPIDVHSVSQRMPLFLDESAHDWRIVRLGRELGWTGVALKTCKTQTGALLSLCWARAHGMQLMVQDLT
ncbi:MAG: hypothetical protein RJA29_2271, partial [Pseudomonadota bacterium]